MQKIENTNFRDVYHMIAFISDNSSIKSLMKECEFPGEKRNGVLVYGYIDVEAGFTFEILCNALKTDEKIKLYTGNDKVSVKLRRGSVSDCTIDILNLNEIGSYKDKIDIINRYYNGDEQLNITRNITLIDECRNDDFPDDVLVYIATAETQPEGCWVRCKRVDGNGIVGILLNEPIQNIGIHYGDEIKFGVMKKDDKNICVALI